MQPPKKEKVRIFALARELGMESKDLLTICQQHGLDIRNQLSTIEPEVRDQILVLVKSAGHQPQPQPTPPPPPQVLPTTSRRIVNLDERGRTGARPEGAKGPAPVGEAAAMETPPAPAPKQTGTIPAPAAAKAAEQAAPARGPGPATPAVPSPAPARESVTPTPQVQAPPVTPGTPASAVPPSPAPVQPATSGQPAPVQASEKVPAPAPQAPAAPAPMPAVPVAKRVPTLPSTVAPPGSSRTTPGSPSQEKQVIPAEKTQPPQPTPPAAAGKQGDVASPAQVPDHAGAKAKEPTQAPVRPVDQAAPVTPPSQKPEAPRPVGQKPAHPVNPPSTPTPPPVRPSSPVPSGQGEGSRPATGPGGLPPINRPPIRNLNTGGQRQGGGPGPQSGQGQPRREGPRPQPQGQDRGKSPPPGGQQPQRTPPPQQQQRQPKQPEPKKPEPASNVRKIGDIPPELLASMQGRGAPLSVKDIEEGIRQHQQGGKPAGPGVPGTVPLLLPEEDDDDRPSKDKKRRPAEPGGVPGRADRHKERSERQAKRKAGGEETRGKSATLLLEEEERVRKDRRAKRPKQPPTVQRKGKIPITLPITVRSLSEAIGRKAGEVLFKLLAHGMAPSTTINSSIESEVAELVALEFGSELDIKREADAEQNLLDSHDIKKDRPDELVPRAPVVAVMGHVDHGKTSLLDRIREQYGIKSDIVSTEAGGITQVLRAWRVEKDGKPITFLDTPGHEAFTKMRARGANVTDIAVIVCAANDGVMPQTEEAISHAKAAEVSIVVAINKVDLPDANIRKTEQQLMSLGLVPDNMGGDVPFVHTSARSGKGIDDLLEQISVVAELKELTANPNKPASGVCLEAYLSEKEGVQATLLVQNGTIRPGDVVLCGASYGTVRRLFDDLGRGIDQAGPSVPVRILGLDEVPLADDTFHVVPDLTTARDMALERRERIQEKAQRQRAPLTLDSLKDAKIAELKVILKAEARGSIEAIRNELEKLHHEEVRVRILHTGIGGINVSDVQLALTSPQDTIILGFNVVPDNEAKDLAEERGIQIRQYDIIYKLADDIRSALEGKLKPREEVVYLGRANVRETFKISRVGTIAGCFVTQGVIERNAKVRVIRGGVVVYPPAERSAGLESLKRFKDDVREVREGFECGLKIAGFDDIKVDDVIECYRIEQVQRSLS